MGHPRLSEEVQDRHRRAKKGNRPGSPQDQPTEGLTSDEDIEPVTGSGNIFRDFGDDYPGLRALRADLAAAVLRTLDERGLTVRSAEAATGVPAADFSRIRNVNLDRFTVDRLAKILWKLGVDFDATLAFGVPAGHPVR